MAGRLIGNGSASSSTVASPSASRRTIERRVGSDKAAKTTSNRSGAVTGIVAVLPFGTSQSRYLTGYANIVNGPDHSRGNSPPDRWAISSRRGPALEHDGAGQAVLREPDGQGHSG